MKRLLLFLSAVFIATTAIAETVSIKWQHGNTTYSQSTCTVGNNLDVPTSHPTKYGYDFVGWRAKAARELEYLTVLRGAYIDTGIIYDTDEIEFDIKFTRSYKGSYSGYVFGAGGTGYNGRILKGMGLYERSGSSVVMFGFGSSENHELSLTPGNTETNTCNLKISGTIISGKCDDYESKSLYIVRVSIPNTIYLGALNSQGYSLGGGTQSYYGGSLYYFKIKKDGVLVRDFIPASDTDGVVCFYDKVTKQFFYNAGGANFVAGPIKE